MVQKAVSCKVSQKDAFKLAACFTAWCLSILFFEEYLDTNRNLKGCIKQFNTSNILSKMNQMDLTDSYRIFYPTAAECIFDFIQSRPHFRP
jgi:hypothetical protein